MKQKVQIYIFLNCGSGPVSPEPLAWLGELRAFMQCHRVSHAGFLSALASSRPRPRHWKLSLKMSGDQDWTLKNGPEAYQSVARSRCDRGVAKSKNVGWTRMANARAY